jgi:tRNA nucleotidyltransferase (CCA-adding enzyme)
MIIVCQDLSLEEELDESYAKSSRGALMQIVAAHMNMDFDALASMVGATFLYPGATGILPGLLRDNVREFLAVHRDLFRIDTRNSLDVSRVSRLIVVDANNWKRLDRMGELKKKHGLDIHLWDHHLKGGDIEPVWKCQEESGATITLILREMRKRDCAFSPMHATLFLMGIYEDTGNLTYPGVTPEDAHMAGFLLENGADLNAAGAYLSSSIDEEHAAVLRRMLDVSETFKPTGGYTVGLGLMSVESGLTSLAMVVAKYKEITGVDIAIGVFFIDRDKCMVIGRGGLTSLDLGAIMRKLGGGGHPGAGSAMIKSVDPEIVRQWIKTLIRETDQSVVHVRDIMSTPQIRLSSATSMEDARVVIKQSRTKAVIIMDDGQLTGILSESDCQKAKTDAQRGSPVKAFMKRDFPVVSPDQDAREALRQMVDTDAGMLPVLENGKLIGMVTRVDLMFHLYDF